MIKSGAEHIASLRDGRAVYLHGQKVADVTTHPAYANAVKTTGRLFDFARQQPELMSFAADTGERANRIWQLPTSYEELVSRRKALEAWNGLHAGFLGRAPDPVASTCSRPTTPRAPGRWPTIIARRGTTTST
jgi:4-hydroxyphenylacetate 3-monooxygenase